MIGIGGNAISRPYSEWVLSRGAGMERVAMGIAEASKGRRLIVTHGNGPQVGEELERNERASSQIPELPLYQLNAETQAVIGTLLEKWLLKGLERLRINKGACTMLTHVAVSGNDSGFSHPTKPIGPFMSAKELAAERKFGKFNYIHNKRGYRKVVASPRPVSILEYREIFELSKHNIVIACGGGGIPVIRDGRSYRGADAVIDKDRTTSLLAGQVGAKRMVLLTDTDYVYMDYESKTNALRSVRTRKLKRILSRFEDGSIRPKLEACIDFIENGGREAYIGNIFHLKDILAGRSGTKIMG